jgi:anti-sigma regulatory factor (Ser/Thr protein kinase)
MIDTMPPVQTTHAERFERLGIPADQRTAASTRDQFAGWLRATFHLEPVRANDFVLAMYEAVANSAEFAYPSALLRGTMDVRASYDSAEGALNVTVADRGQWRTVAPTPTDRSRGRGIALMRALADRASIQTSTHGTTVRLAWLGVRPR